MERKQLDRRSFTKTAVGAAALNSLVTGGSARSGLENAALQIPVAPLGNRQVSRLIIGGNPFSSIAHAEPLVYASRLFREYFKHEKVVETLQIGVRRGINTFLGRIDDNVMGFLNLYRETTGETMPWIAQTSAKAERGATFQEIQDNIRVAADFGAVGCYLQGVTSDFLVAKGKLDEVEAHVELIRKLGLVSGIGAHENQTMQTVIQTGLRPDFLMKTLNGLGLYDDNPQRTVEIMKQSRVPWIAFKVLAAGRVTPEEGFKLALESGADFLCVGMFDFQVEENTTLFSRLIAEMT